MTYEQASRMFSAAWDKSGLDMADRMAIYEHMRSGFKLANYKSFDHGGDELIIAGCTYVEHAGFAGMTFYGYLEKLGLVNE